MHGGIAICLAADPHISHLWMSIKHNHITKPSLLWGCLKGEFFFFPNLKFDPLKLSIMYKIIARYCKECLLTPLKSLASTSVGKFACQNFGGACHIYSIIWPTLILKCEKDAC